MPSVEVRSQVSYEELLKAVAQLGAQELEHFVAQVLALSGQGMAPRLAEEEAKQTLGRESHRELLEPRRVIDRLHETREAISSGYADIVSREHAWRAFQQLATESLWDAVKDLEDDPYRQQLADVLDAAIAKLQAFQLEEKHLSAIDLTLARLSASEVTEQDVDTCENAWRDVGVDTLPSLGEALEEWLASSELGVERAQSPA